MGSAPGKSIWEASGNPTGKQPRPTVWEAWRGGGKGGGGGVGGGIGGDDSSKSATAVAMPLLEMIASWSVDVFGTARGCREASGVEFGRFHRRRRRRKKTGSRGDADDGLPLVLATAADAA